MRKKVFISIFVVALFATLFYGFNYVSSMLTLSKTNPLGYMTTIPTAVPIVNNDSKLFKYEASLSLKKENNEYVRANYIIRITPYSKQVLKKFGASGFIDKSLASIFPANTLLVFGSTASTLSTLNKDTIGLEIATSTLVLCPSYDDNFIKNVNQPIRVVTYWDNGQENVLVPINNIKLTVTK